MHEIRAGLNVCGLSPLRRGERDGVNRHPRYEHPAQPRSGAKRVRRPCTGWTPGHRRQSDTGVRRQEKAQTPKMPVVKAQPSPVNKAKGCLAFVLRISWSLPNRSLNIISETSVWAKVGEKSSNCEKVELSSLRLDCIAAVDLKPTELQAGVANVELELYLRQGALIGAATTQGPVQLPFWVELRPYRKD